MHTLKRILGAYAIVVALAVAVTFILTPFFFDDDTGYPVWHVLGYFRAGAILIIIAASSLDMWQLCKAGKDADLKRYVSVNVYFFSTIVLSLLFFSNWTASLVSHGSLENYTIWAIVDAILPPIVGAGGLRLWRTAPVWRRTCPVHPAGLRSQATGTQKKLAIQRIAYAPFRYTLKKETRHSSM